MSTLRVGLKGGPGSGNRGHSGRPGVRGGSAPKKGNIGSSVSFMYYGGKKPKQLGGVVKSLSKSGKFVRVDMADGTTISVSVGNIINSENDVFKDAIDYSNSQWDDNTLYTESMVWKDSLTSDEEEAVWDYVNSDFNTLNSYMRHGTSTHAKEKAELLQSALGKTVPLQKDTILYRGMGSTGRKEYYDSLRPGDTIRDKGFVSTTISRGFAVDEVASEKGAVMRILAKKGTKGGYVPSVGIDWEGVKAEREFLFPSNALFEVVRRHEQEGKLFLDVIYSPGSGVGDKEYIIYKENKKKPTRIRKFVWEADDIIIIKKKKKTLRVVAEEKSMSTLRVGLKGGPGSGNRGHGGRPGKRGGSSPKSSGFGVSIEQGESIHEYDMRLLGLAGSGKITFDQLANLSTDARSVRGTSPESMRRKPPSEDVITGEVAIEKLGLGDEWIARNNALTKLESRWLHAADPEAKNEITATYNEFPELKEIRLYQMYGVSNTKRQSFNDWKETPIELYRGGTPIFGSTWATFTLSTGAAQEFARKRNDTLYNILIKPKDLIGFAPTGATEAFVGAEFESLVTSSKTKELHMIIVRKKGSGKSGNYGHGGRPGLEGGSIPKGGNRVRLSGGGMSKTQPKGKTYSGKPKLSQSSRSGSVPKHSKGDKTGSQAYSSWVKANPDANEKDRASMQSWFGERARAMEHNLNISTVVPGQRPDEDEDKKKKKPEEEKEPEDDKKKPKGKGKATLKKKKAPPKAKAPKAKKKTGVTDEEKAAAMKSVGLSKEDYTQFKNAHDTLKKGGKLDDKTANKLLKSGAIYIASDGNYAMNKASLNLMRKIEKGDVLGSQEAMRSYMSKKVQTEVGQTLQSPEVQGLIEEYKKGAGKVQWEKVTGEWMDKYKKLANKYPSLDVIFGFDKKKKTLRIGVK